MTEPPDDKRRSVLTNRHTRRGVLAGTASLGVIGLTMASSTGNTELLGGSMISEPGKVAEKLWAGPESAVASEPYDVEPKVRRVYKAVDTSTEWYADGDSWSLMGAGSEQTPLPEVHSKSHHTDEVRFTGQLRFVDEGTQ